jgi:hypothetical protein
MRSLQVMADPQHWSLGHGLGLMLYRRGERLYVGHDGGMPGHLSRVGVAPKEKVGAVVLISSTSLPPPGLALALELVEKAIEAFPAARDAWEPRAAPPSELAPLLGRWWSEGGEWVFRYRDGRLEARQANAPPELDPAVFDAEGPDLFRARSGHEAGERLRVVRDQEGRVVKLYWATYPFTRDPRVFGTT